MQWQTAVNQSPYKKAFRIGFSQHVTFVVDEQGTALKFTSPIDNGQKVQPEDWQGFHDWQPVKHAEYESKF